MNQINNYYYLGCGFFGYFGFFLVLAVGFVVLFVVVFIKAVWKI